MRRKKILGEIVDFRKKYEVTDIEPINIKREREDKQERYKTQRGTRKNEKQKQKSNKRLKKRIAMIAASAILAVGTLGAVGLYKNSKEANTVQKRIEMNSTASDMGISEETLQEYQQLAQRTMGVDNLDEASRTELAEDIDEFTIASVKEKLANSLGIENPESSITLTAPNEANEPAVIDINGEKYVQTDFVDMVLKRNNTIDEKIADVIIADANLQTDIDNKEILNNDIIKVMEKVTKFLAGDLEISEDGNITINFEKVKNQSIKDSKETKDKSTDDGR